MKKYLCTLAMLCVFFGNSHCQAQEADTAKIFNTLFKCWRAVSHEYSPIYGLEEDEIKTYSAQKVCLSRDSIKLYDGAQYAPKYSINKANADSFARANFDCGKVNLGIIKDSVYEIDISATSQPDKKGITHKMTNVIAFDGDFIYVVKDGVIFKLYDGNFKNMPRSSN